VANTLLRFYHVIAYFSCVTAQSGKFVFNQLLQLQKQVNKSRYFSDRFRIPVQSSS